MAKVSFVLKQPNTEKETLVYLLFRYHAQTLKYSTGLNIHPKFWNGDKQRAKETRSFPGYVEFNALLVNLESTIQNRFRELINDKIEPTPELLRVPLDEYLQKGIKKEFSDLIAFAEHYVETSNRKPGTKKQLRQAIRNLREFKAYSRRNMSFESVDIPFYNEFVRFLVEERKYGTNTIGTLIKNLKVFMNEAVERNLTTNVQYRNKRFKTMEEHSESIYLSIEEINKIYHMNLRTQPRLDRVRDLFIIGCFTGLRFSDLKQLRDENLIDNRTKMRIRTEKTGEIVVIPLHPYVKEILKKHNGVPPESLTNQKMNDYLKEIGDWAGIHETVMLQFTKGGERQKQTYKKFELITTHTARRSFATNAYLNDVPTISLMKLTGHRTEKSFMKYIKISQEDNANKLLSHPFFNQ
jgi:integrase